MQNYESKLNHTGEFFLLSLQEQFPHIEKTEKLVLDILSLQERLIWDTEMQAWILEKKRKQHGKFNVTKFAGQFISKNSVFPYTDY